MKKLALVGLAFCLLVLGSQTFSSWPKLLDLPLLKSPCKVCVKCKCNPCQCSCLDGKCPVPEPKVPDKPKRPWRSTKEDSVESITLGGKIAPDNQTQIQIDFPLGEHIENIGSHVDGAGMCVMSSIEMASRWQNLEKLRGLRDWCAKQPGGGYPSKVDKQLQEYFKKLGETKEYVQYEGSDISILRVALATGRFPAVTYAGRDKVRYSGTIAHMVCLAHLDEQYAAIYDNNGKPGEIIWMSPEEFKSRWLYDGSGWAFIWLAPPPPPVPN